MFINISLLLCTLFAVALADDATCYSSLPSSFKSGVSYLYQSSGYCTNECSGYTYIALFNGTTCYCGNDAPDSSDEVDSSECSVGCSGYDSETCGGTSAYQVVKIGSDSSSSTSGSSSSSQSSTGTTSTTASSSNTATTTATTTGTPTTKHSSGSTYVELVTQVSTQSGGGTHVVTVTASKTSVATSVVDNSSESDNTKNKAKLIGPIVGGVIGGLAALSILALVIFFIRRQRQKDRDLLDADANIIATVKRSENQGHTKQLSNPFADDFVDPRATTYFGVPEEQNETRYNSMIPDLPENDQYYSPATSRPKLAVVNPDKD